MKHTIRRRRHLRPRPSRAQIRQHIAQYETALAVLRTEAAFELRRPSPSPDRIRWMQERANQILELIANAETYA